MSLELKPGITLYLARHGQTVANQQHRFSGKRDTPLTELGLTQVRAVGRIMTRAVGMRPALNFVSSPLARAQQSMEIVRSELGLPKDGFITDARIQEIDLGEWDQLTDEEARARAEGDTFFQFSLRFYGQSSGRRRPPAGTVNMWDEYQKWKAANPEQHAAALRGGLIGSPETIRKKLKRFQSSNIDQVVLLNQAGRNTHEHICESLELFAKEVMPEFQAAHPELLKWKERVLNRELDLEEIDTTAFKDRYGGTMKAMTPAAAAVRAAD